MAPLRTGRNGFTLMGTSVVLGILGILSASALASFDLGRPVLGVAQHELRGTLDQAFTLARARGRNITVKLRQGKGPDTLAVEVPSRIKWGKPGHVPLPKGMDEPVRADAQGEAHASITVTPRRTATASAWFLNDGKDVLCMRLSGRGQVQMLRWRAERKTWENLAL